MHKWVWDAQTPKIAFDPCEQTWTGSNITNSLVCIFILHICDFITLSGQLRIQIAERIMLHTHRSASMVYTNIGHTLNIHGIASFIWFGLVWFDVIQKHQNTTMISHKTLQRQFLLSNIISKWYGLFYSSFLYLLNVTASTHKRTHFIRVCWMCYAIACAYNIHRLRCWHSFAVCCFFFSLLHARFSDFFSFGCMVEVLILSPFFFVLTYFLYHIFFFLLWYGTCVFYFCLLWHLDSVHHPYHNVISHWWYNFFLLCVVFNAEIK